MSSSEAPSAKPKSRTPELSTAIVTSLARDLYGLHVQTCQELDSYVDRNYHLTVAAVGPAPNKYIAEVCAEGYVLKVLNAEDSKHAADVATEAAVLHYVHEKGLGTPRLVPTIDGHHFVFCSFSTEGHQQSYAIVKQNEAEEEEKKGEEKKEEEKEEKKKEHHAVRLLEYVPGRPLVTVPLTAHLCFQLGQHAARLDTVLQDFDDSNHQVPGEHWIWKMENLTSLRHLLDVIKDSALQGQISEVFDLMEARLLNAKAREQFRIGYIHGDYNAHNILVSRSSKEETSNPSPISPPSSPEPNPPDSASLSPYPKTSTTARENSPPPTSSSSSLSASSPGEWGVTGVVDFGDMTKTFVLLEPAVAISGVILTCPEGEDPDVYAGHVLSGYLSQVPLSRQEIELLPLVIRARFTQHLVLGNHTLSRDPHNLYVSAFLAPVQRHFLRLCHTSEDLTLQLWKVVASAWDVKFPDC